MSLETLFVTEFSEDSDADGQKLHFVKKKMLKELKRILYSDSCFYMRSSEIYETCILLKKVWISFKIFPTKMSGVFLFVCLFKSDLGIETEKVLIPGSYLNLYY